jgi:cyclopropane-fatty-acyl-phospholipid synthase
VKRPSENRTTPFFEHDLTFAAGSAPAASHPMDRVAARVVDRMLRRTGASQVAVTLWNGTSIGATAPRFRVRLNSRATLARVLLDPEFQLPECYADGALDIEGDLIGFFDSMLGGGPQRASWRSQATYALDRAWRKIRPAPARRNARHHYDLSNAFYRAWLDESMTYTCAYFATPRDTLERAQQAKLELVCRKLALRPGHRVIEVGCGWGSLAVYMAQRHGVTVTAYNVSREQIDYARERAKLEGVTDRVTFVEDDYRNVTGTCDAFVAVGLLEHVERDRYAELGALIKRCLAPQGLALVHTIGRHRRLPPPRWTRRRIFPGGYMPSLSEITEIFAPNDLTVLDLENLRLHYVRTLEHWLARFEAAEDVVAEMFDERFLRMWRLYLASACAGFRTGWMQLFQLVFTHSRNNAVPLRRAV